MEGQDHKVFFAAEGSGGGGSFAPTLLMMALLFGAMYFLFIRPNKRRRQQIEQMQSSIGPGDEVVTIGGLYGVVQEIDDSHVLLEVAPGVVNRYTRASVSQVVTAAVDPDELPADDDDDDADLTSDDNTARVDTTKKVVDTD